MLENTMKKRSYIVSHFIVSLFLILTYVYVLFKEIEGMTIGQSILVLTLLILGGVFVGVALTYYNERNIESLIYNVLFPWCIYICIFYRGIYAINIDLGLIMTGVLSLICVAFIFFRKIKRADKKKVLAIRVKKALLSIQRVSVLILIGSVVLPVLYLSIVTNDRVEEKEEDIENVSAETSDMEQYTMDNHMETLKKIQEDEWEKLSLEGRISVCQTIANIEANRLGLQSELHVVVGDLEEGVQGQYSHVEKRIELDQEYLLTLPSYNTLTAVCHEVRHAYQHCLVEACAQIEENSEEFAAFRELAVFREVEKYEEEFRNYIDPATNTEAYQAQACEQDADEYAEESAKEYFRCLEEHLNLVNLLEN